MVSVPLQGTYLPYAEIEYEAGYDAVSVPLQGTYLPYVVQVIPLLKNMGFRPLAGDLSSLLKVAEVDTVVTGFRPLAGDLSSLQELFRALTGDAERFPSPCRGLIFLTQL